MKSREAFNKVLASALAVSLGLAAPAAAAPIASVAVSAPIGGAPVGAAGVLRNAPGMNFSPLGASLSAPTLTGSVLPGVNAHPVAAPQSALQAAPAPTFLPNVRPTARTQVPMLPPALSAGADAAISGRARQVVERGAVTGVQDLKETDKATDGLPKDVGDSLNTVRGKRNRLGLRFTELRKAFGMPADDASFAPQGAAVSSLQGRDAGGLTARAAAAGAGTVSSEISAADRMDFSRGYLARAARRLAGLVSLAPAAITAKAPTPLGVDFSLDRMAVSIFGASPAGVNAADFAPQEGVAARDRILRVAVPAPGRNFENGAAPQLENGAAAQTASLSARAYRAGAMMFPSVSMEAAHSAAARTFADDAPLRRWLRGAVARLHAAAAFARGVSFSFSLPSGRRTVSVPLPALTARSASGWSAWLSSLILPLSALYVYFTAPRLALVPVPVSRPRA